MTIPQFSDSGSVTSTTAAISAYVDYTPRRKAMPMQLEPFDHGVSMSRQQRTQYFHQLAQQSDNDDDDYMNSPSVRRYHGFTNPMVPIKDDSHKPKGAPDTTRQWSIEDFDVGQCLGSGRFGTVYIAKELETGTVVALKTMKKREIQDAKVVRFLKREIEIQSHLGHPNILRLYGYFHNDDHVYIVLEHAPGKSLYDVLQRGPLPEEKVAEYMAQVVDGVRYIHRLGVLHRDIKPENILIGAKGQLKLADFGWAVHDRRARRQTFCGTLDYLAPEMIEKKAHDEKVDIWALGVLCYELLVGRPPFEEPDDYAMTYRRIVQLRYTFPSQVSINAQHFVTRILQHDPRKRPRLDDLDLHPWLQAARR